MRIKKDIDQERFAPHVEQIVHALLKLLQAKLINETYF